MKSRFIEKKIYFFGDSITQDGRYLYNLRAYFQTQKEKCYVFNRGIAGSTTSQTAKILEWELGTSHPDYAFISFGINDMGRWLYQAQEETEELFKKRAQRDTDFFVGYESIIDQLLSQGIQPVILSPFAVNESFVEQENIETIIDNKDKANNIVSGMYTHKTFKRLNEHLAFYTEKLRELALKKGVLFFDIFTKTKQLAERTSGLFAEDGIHYNEKGQDELAKIILQYLGCHNIPEQFQKTEINDKIFEIEKAERSIMFIPGNIFNPLFGKCSLVEMLEYARLQLTSENAPKWLQEAAKNFLEKREEIPQMRKRIEEMVYSL